MDQTTKIYYNSTNKDINVLGVDVVPAGESVSVTSQFQPPVVLANYPGLLDITDTGISGSSTSTSSVSASASSQTTGGTQ